MSVLLSVFNSICQSCNHSNILHKYYRKTFICSSFAKVYMDIKAA